MMSLICIINMGTRLGDPFGEVQLYKWYPCGSMERLMVIDGKTGRNGLSQTLRTPLVMKEL